MSDTTNKQSRHARALRGSRGSTAVEMAILSPLLFAATIGALEVGRGVWTDHILSHVAREATRYAAVRSSRSEDPATTASITARARDAAVGIDTDALVVETTWEPANDRNATVQVRVSYLFQPGFGLLPFRDVQLTSSSRQVIVY